MTDALSDEELAALALAAPREPALGDDAVPIRALGAPAGALLPEWYMPPPAASTHAEPGWRRRVAIVVIAAVLLINAAGLCVTYGVVTFG